MASTYTTGWFDVQHGDVTTHNPQDLVAEDDPIELFGAEVQWEGIQTTNTSTEHDTQTNSNTATDETYYEYNTNSDSAVSSYSNGSWSGRSASADMPSYPSGNTFHRHSITHTVTNRKFAEWNDVTIQYDTDSGTEYETVDLGVGESIELHSEYVYSERIGDTFSISHSEGMDDIEVKVELQTESAYKTVHTVDDTPLPTSPDDYDFDSHEYEITVENLTDTEQSYSIDWSVPWTSGASSGDLSGGETAVVRSGGISTNYSGESITASDTDTDIQVTITASTKSSREVTSTEDTQDPRVTRDVTGESGGITLTDGEQSNWYTLNGLEVRDEEFYHDIDGSGQARFRFRFDWERIHPSKAHGIVGFHDDTTGVWRECIVADPTDSNLQYNHVTVYNASTGTWGALDVVDPSDEHAIEEFAFYDPDVGWVAPREYTTTSA